jgi:hypothetical protein
LAKLTLTGLALGAACERAHQPEEACKTVIVEEDTSLADAVRAQPAVAPKLVPQPQPQQQQQQPTPQPVIQKKPKPRKVWASVCGGPAELVDADAALVKCGQG